MSYDAGMETGVGDEGLVSLNTVIDSIPMSNVDGQTIQVTPEINAVNAFETVTSNVAAAAPEVDNFFTKNKNMLLVAAALLALLLMKGH